jgi:hypothetical protein
MIPLSQLSSARLADNLYVLSSAELVAIAVICFSIVAIYAGIAILLAQRNKLLVNFIAHRKLGAQFIEWKDERKRWV